MCVGHSPKSDGKQIFWNHVSFDILDGASLSDLLASASDNCILEALPDILQGGTGAEQLSGDAPWTLCKYHKRTY